MQRPRNKRILHLIHWPKSGITSVVKNLVSAMGSDTFEQAIIVLLEDAEELEEFRSLGLQVLTLGGAQSLPRKIFRLQKHIRKFAPDIIHSHSFQPGVWARVLGYRSAQVVTIHSCYDYVEKKNLAHRIKASIEAISIRWSDSKVICVSEAVRRHTLRFSDIDPAALSVLHNGIVTANFTCPDASVKSAHAHDELRLVTVARLSKEKRLEVLLQAIARCKALGRFVRLAIVGDGPERLHLQAKTAELDINDLVEYVGYKKDVRPWLWRAHVYVCTSSIEGLPMSILEAQAAGLAVIATHVGGIPEIIRDRENGFLLAGGDPEELASCIKNLNENPRLLETIILRGIETVRAEFDIAKVADRHLDIYKSLIAEPENK